MDHVYDKQAAAQGNPVDFFGATPAWTGRVLDLSFGGICLLLPQEQNHKEFAERCVWLHFSLPPVALDVSAEVVTLTLRLLGVIRAARTHQSSCILHVRFLDRLPDAFGPLLTRMEREATSLQKPAKGEREHEGEGAVLSQLSGTRGQ